jgi:EAL domain-containing protein (putative c-di-GMP-specific phosphodiesterase class I)/CheY-like chemotaxis protein
MTKTPVLAAFDDDPQILEIVSRIAEQAGYQPVFDTQPDRLLAALAEHQPRLIVLDLQMPRMDGIQVLRALADLDLNAGIVLLTGMDERTMAAAEGYAQARGLNMVATLQKPFVPEDLLQILREAGDSLAELTPENLRDAIINEELVVYYQPTIRRFADGSWDIAAMEALLRWNHPTKGLLSPDCFIELGETHGLGRAMTDFVIQRGIEQLKGWKLLRMNLGLRINISAGLIADLDFPDRLEATLAAHDIDPSLLTLELTETAMLGQNADMFDIMTRLRVKNVNLAIDDFGIGYSSLTQLFAMPFNEMKIDKSLMMRTPQSKEASIMVAALVDLAHKLNLTVCAEGVETEEALRYLASIGCDSAQGFFISQPIPAARVKDIVSRWDHSVQADTVRQAATS